MWCISWAGKSWQEGRIKEAMDLKLTAMLRVSKPYDHSQAVPVTDTGMPYKEKNLLIQRSAYLLVEFFPWPLEWISRAGKMTQQVKALFAKPDNWVWFSELTERKEKPYSHKLSSEFPTQEPAWSSFHLQIITWKKSKHIEWMSRASSDPPRCKYFSLAHICSSCLKYHGGLTGYILFCSGSLHC